MPFVAQRKDYREITSEFSSGNVKQYALTGHPLAEYDFQVKSKDAVSIMAYELSEGGSIPQHCRDEKQVLINFDGDTEIVLTHQGEQANVILTRGDVLNVPQGASYSLTNLRGNTLTYCILGSDQPKKLQGA